MLCLSAAIFEPNDKWKRLSATMSEPQVRRKIPFRKSVRRKYIFATKSELESRKSTL